MCKRFGASDVPYTSGTYGEHRLVLELLEQTEWIPVTERLPENIRNVLVTLEEHGMVATYISFYVPSEHRWNNDDNVIAWMPLPKPYKEGE